jgi:hypothetical protein
MRRGNRAGLEVTVDRSRGPGKIGKDESALSAPAIPRLSHEILRDLGMSDDAIAQYFCRFRHGQLEQSVQMAMHNRGWTCRRWRSI